MLMTMQVRFDPLKVAPKVILDVVVAAGVAESDCKLTVNRAEPIKAKPKPVATKSA